MDGVEMEEWDLLQWMVMPRSIRDNGLWKQFATFQEAVDYGEDEILGKGYGRYELYRMYP